MIFLSFLPSPWILTDNFNSLKFTNLHDFCRASKNCIGKLLSINKPRDIKRPFKISFKKFSKVRIFWQGHGNIFIFLIVIEHLGEVNMMV